MSERTAVAIVGGGAMGSSIAYHLKSDPNFTGRVVVIERDPSYARASSALSASSIRQQFSTPLNIHLSRYGIGFLRRARELLDVDLGLKEPGYLFLASAAGESVLRANHAIQKGEGCAVELLDPAALAGRFPAISASGVALASHGTANEGWFDGPALMQGFHRKARELGAEYVADEVVRLVPHKVTLKSGATIEADTIVLCTGQEPLRELDRLGMILVDTPDGLHLPLKELATFKVSSGAVWSVTRPTDGERPVTLDRLREVTEQVTHSCAPRTAPNRPVRYTHATTKTT